MDEILVKTLMTSNVDCLPSEAHLREAVNLMVTQGFSCIVINEGSIPLGILTERDLVIVLNGEDHEQKLDMPVSDFMSSPVLSLNQNKSLFEALVFTNAENIRHIPAVNDNDELVGLITHSDLVNAHFRVTERQTKLVEEAIASKTQDLQQLNKELQALSMEDYLMKIGNRRAMEVDLNHTHASALRYRQVYSLLLLDIDYFKRYNDYYGHQKGDDALVQVCNIIKNNIRSSDRLYRYGGEELLLILPRSSAALSAGIAEKLINAIALEKIPHENGPEGYLTISGGCASVYTEQDEMLTDWKHVVKAADKALYQAKESGRNKAVTFFPQ